MGKALKVFIVLNFLLGVVVITLGIQSFSARKILKAQALELEKSLAKISEDLQWGEKVPWENPGEEKQVLFRFSQPTNAEGLANLKNEIEPLGRVATQREAQLSQRNLELAQTHSQLETKKQNLASRESELVAAQKQEASLKIEKWTKVTSELSDLKAEVANLQTGKSEKESGISTKNSSLTELNNQLASLEIDLETRIQERDNVQAEYERCRTGEAGEAGEKLLGTQIRGKKGVVLAVNQDWEYVVIDKGDTIVEPDFKAYVHRGNEYIGKLNVLRVEENLAVAEIVPGSLTEGQTIQPGDTLFF